MAPAVQGLSNPYLPSQPRFLGGALFGTLAGSLFLVPFDPLLLGLQTGTGLGWFAMLPLTAAFMLCLFLSAGWPLFLAFRGAAWPRAWMAGAAGGGLGAGVSLLVPFSQRWLALVCLGGAGVLAATVCWRFIYWPVRHGAAPGRGPA